MSADHARPIYVAILGTDALLAARPIDPVQLTRACQVAGFDLVVPVSWGEELIATHLALRVGADNGGSAVAAVCPKAADMLSTAPISTRVLKTVSPPVATARHVRAALHPRRLHVTYVGGCPGGADPEIDVHCLPHVLFAKLVDSGIDVSRQPRHLDGQLPVERARYASIPGGVPETNWLLAHAGARVVDAAPITVDVVTQVYRDDALLLDVARACTCVCAHDRSAAARLEPPRATKAVVDDVRVQVGVGDSQIPEPQLPSGADQEPVEHDRRAKFAENGLSSGEPGPLPEITQTLSQSREPW